MKTPKPIKEKPIKKLSTPQVEKRNPTPRKLIEMSTSIPPREPDGTTGQWLEGLHALTQFARRLGVPSEKIQLVEQKIQLLEQSSSMLVHSRPSTRRLSNVEEQSSKAIELYSFTRLSQVVHGLLKIPLITAQELYDDGLVPTNIVPGSSIRIILGHLPLVAIPEEAINNSKRIPWLKPYANNVYLLVTSMSPTNPIDGNPIIHGKLFTITEAGKLKPIPINPRLEKEFTLGITVPQIDDDATTVSPPPT